jgi:hypothetical protein
VFGETATTAGTAFSFFSSALTDPETRTPAPKAPAAVHNRGLKDVEDLEKWNDFLEDDPESLFLF